MWNSDFSSSRQASSSQGNPGRIPTLPLYCLLLICLLIFVSSCGGGGNSTFDPVSGKLSIEKIISNSSGGSVAVRLISPYGSGPGTGTITISAGGSDLVTFSPASQTADASGNAIFTYTTKEVQADTAVNFTVGVGALSLTNTITIPAAGTLLLSVTLPSDSNEYGSITASYAGGSKGAGRTITITSDKKDNIAFDTTSQIADANGQATFTYRPVGLTSNTTVKFSAATSAQLVSQNILIPATTTSTAPTVDLTVNSISYVSASPTTISLKGTGGAGRSETSILTFVVKDNTGQPIAGQTVDFALDTSVGGLTILPASAVSDSTGTVKTIVNAGVVSTPVRITAAVRDKNISVKSDQLTVSTGLPHQDGLSVSMETFNPEGWSHDNVQIPITVMLSDHFGNPVPDGTAVYFSCYGGSIEPSATTWNGIASVKWRSQDPRPSDGIAKILVYTIGEESFIDLNGNGVADAGEFTDLPEAFLSISGQSTRDPLKDPFIDFNFSNNSSYISEYDTGDGKFNGVLQSAAYSGAPRSLHVFKNVRMVMSGSDPVFYTKSGTEEFKTITDKIKISGNSFAIAIADINGNPMPRYTAINFAYNDDSCSGESISPVSLTINNTSSVQSDSVNVSACSNTGTLVITVKTPKGIVTTRTFQVTN